MSQNTRKKRKRRRERAKKVLKRIQPARASDYIFHLPELLKITANFPLILCPRVSTEEQRKNGNLERQAERMIWAITNLTDRSVRYVVIPIVWPGGVSESYLEFVTILAIEYGAIPVFESTDRIIRGEGYNPITNASASATAEQFEDMKKITGWVPISTILHPDTDWQDIKAYQSKFEQERIGNFKPGLPKCEIRKKCLQTVLELRGYGMSYGNIAKSLNLSKSTVYKWCQNND